MLRPQQQHRRHPPCCIVFVAIVVLAHVIQLQVIRPVHGFQTISIITCVSPLHSSSASLLLDQESSSTSTSFLLLLSSSTITTKRRSCIRTGNNHHHYGSIHCNNKLRRTTCVRGILRQADGATGTHDDSSNDDSRNRMNRRKLDKGFNLLELTSGIFPQGKLVQTASGTWNLAWKRMMAELAPQDETGSYQRPTYSYTSSTTSTTSSIATADQLVDLGRYHLYVGNPCPWCHRAVLAANLLGLSKIGRDGDETAKMSTSIGITRLEDNPYKASRGGWIFSKERPDTIFDGCYDLRELYDKLIPGYTGRCTAPLLVDGRTRQIISNESSDIIRWLNRIAIAQATNAGDNESAAAVVTDLYPSDLAKLIDETNDWVYRLVNNGVYRCGFSTTQSAYDRASQDVLAGLSKCDDILSKQTYMCSNDRITETDVRLLPTILRYDAVYSPLFHAGGTHIRIQCDYPNIHRWLKHCFNTYNAEISTSIDIQDACSSYYKSLFPLNPSNIIPTKTITMKSIGLE